jgi:hypothetical protein
MKNLICFLSLLVSSSLFAQSLTVSGNLSHVAAIGGETSGFSVNGQEVDLSNFRIHTAIPDGSGIVISGQLQERQGPTRGSYQVLIAEEVQVSIRGLIVGMMAIGGETAGVALETEEGRLFELDLSNLPLLPQTDLLDRVVDISGKIERRQGISRKNFEVLTVKNILQ